MALHGRKVDTGYQGHIGQYQRSDGPLSQQELTAARKAGVKLLFDPIQNGWVRADAIDDFCVNQRRPGWPTVQEATSRSSQISLRMWENTDADVFRVLLDNPAVWEHLPIAYPGPITIDMARDLIALSKDTHLHDVRAITKDGTPVGQVRLEFGAGEPELSYWLGQPYWGKGIGSRAVSGFADSCFDRIPYLDHMVARAKSENRASVRILEKAGFLRERRSIASPEWIILRRDRTTSGQRAP